MESPTLGVECTRLTGNKFERIEQRCILELRIRSTAGLGDVVLI